MRFLNHHQRKHSNRTPALRRSHTLGIGAALASLLFFSAQEASADGADVSPFLSADGTFDIERAREAGFEGELDLSGVGIALPGGTSSSFLGGGGCGVPAGGEWLGGFGDPATFQGPILCAVVFDGELIVGGTFDDSQENGVRYVARWDGERWFDTGWMVEGEVRSLLVFDGDLIAGTPDGIYEWDGALDWTLTWGANGAVNGLRVFDQELYAGGDFTTIDGTAASAIAAWDGMAWSAVGSGVNGVVHELGTYDGDLIVTGKFSTAGGGSAQSIASWDGQTWSGLGSGLELQGNPGIGHALIEWNGDLIVAGAFDEAGGSSAVNVARWNGTSWSNIGVGLGVPDPDEILGTRVYDLGIYSFGFSSELIATGDFLTLAGTSSVTLNGLARTSNGSQWTSMDSGLGLPVPGPIGGGQVLIPFEGKMVIGGGFDGAFGAASGEIGNNLIAWEWTGSNNEFSQLGKGFWEFSAGPDATINAARVFQGDLYVGGAFTFGDTHAAIARWDGDAWHKVGGGLYDGNASGTVSAMTTYNNGLLVGGKFTHFGAPGSGFSGGTPCRNLAFWTGTAWELPANDNTDLPNQAVLALHPFEDGIIAGGEFTTPFDHIYKLSYYSQIGWSKSAIGDGGDEARQLNDTVYALRQLGTNDLYVGGKFTANESGSTSLSRIARYDKTTKQFYPVGLGVDGPVHALGLNPINTKLTVGGSFATASNSANDVVSSKNVVMLDSGTWVAMGQGLETVSGGGTVYALTHSDGKIIAGGRFDQNASGWGAPLNNIAVFGATDWIPLGGSIWDSANQESIPVSLGTRGPSGASGGTVRMLMGGNGADLWIGGAFNEVGHTTVSGGTNYGECWIASRFIAQWDGSIAARPQGPAWTTPSSSLSAESQLQLQVRPSPFRPSTFVSFSLTSASNDVSVRVVDVGGRNVRTLHDGTLPAGSHQVIWNGVDDRGNRAAAGTYFVLLQTDDLRAVRKAVMLK